MSAARSALGLRPGPGLAADEVASHQRARISGAMIEALDRRGYEEVTIRELVRLAGVSTHSFYEHFDGKEECLSATQELVMRRAARRFAASRNGEGSSRVRLLRALRGLAEDVVREPAAARLALLDAPSSLGLGRLARPARSRRVWETLASESVSRAMGDAAAPRLVAKGIVAGIAHVLRSRLLVGREAELPVLAGELAEWALCLCGGEVLALAGLEAAPLPPAAAGDGDEGAAREWREAWGEERAMILAAVMRLVAEDGYRGLSASRIRVKAGLPRVSFESNFEGVGDCFVAVCDLAARELAAAALGDGDGGWEEGVHRSSVGLCVGLLRRPAAARLVLVESAAAGREGMRWREQTIGALAERLRAAMPPGQRPGGLAAAASAGAIWGIVEHHVAAGEGWRLRYAAPTLSLLALAPAVGARRAVEAIGASRRRMV